MTSTTPGAIKSIPSHFSRWHWLVTTVLLITGYISFFFDSSANPVVFWLTQWCLLIHISIGTLSIFMLGRDYWQHAQQSLGFRRPWLLLSGFVALFLFVVVYASGFWLTLFGRRAQEAWIHELHMSSTTLFSSLIIIHCIGYWCFRPSKRKSRTTSTTPTKKFTKPTTRQLFITLGTCCVGLFIVNLLLVKKTSTAPNPKHYELPYGNNPFAPSETRISPQHIAKTGEQFIHMHDIANSQSCASCHKDITEQWQSSMHRHSASDQAYVTNIELLAQTKGIAATRYCEGCHAPIALLTGQLTEGGQHGGTANTDAFEQGISCMSCHGITEISHTKGNGSYIFQPATPYLFNQLIAYAPERHKQEMLTEVQHSSEVCASCHAQFMDKSMNNWGWVQLQDDYAAWLKSPYSGQNQTDHPSSKETRCQDCHMPLVKAQDPSSDDNGMVRSHRFIAANDVIPALNNNQTQAALTKEFLSNDKLRLSLHIPPAKDAKESLQKLNSHAKQQIESADYLYLGESTTLSVLVTNNGVGHNFPGGTIDLQQAWIQVDIHDAQGRLLLSSGDTTDDTPNPNSYFYRSIPVDTTGAHVWRHDLFNSIGHSFKRVIAPGETDIAPYEFSVPYFAESPITITAKLNYQKFNDAYARWALKEDYQPASITTLAWKSLVIPLTPRDLVTK